MSGFGRVAVVCGGCSSEREVSLVSGRCVLEGLESAGIQANYLDVEQTHDIADSVQQFDAVFLMLHGGDGEDGTVQQLLEDHGKPYTGSGPLASALALDKLATKRVLDPLGICTPRALSWAGHNARSFADAVLTRFSLPVVVKARSEGSSFGIRLASSARELQSALDDLHQEYGTVIAEEFIQGRELSIPVLRIAEVDVPLPIVEIVIQNDLFDHQAKYNEGMHELISPAKLDVEATVEIQRLALFVHRALGCWGYSRVDIMLSNDSLPHVLEVNTLPGMTPESIMPESASAMGLSYSALVEQMLRSASTRPPRGDTFSGVWQSEPL